MKKFYDISWNLFAKVFHTHFLYNAVFIGGYDMPSKIQFSYVNRTLKEMCLICGSLFFCQQFIDFMVVFINESWFLFFEAFEDDIFYVFPESTSRSNLQVAVSFQHLLKVFLSFLNGFSMVYHYPNPRNILIYLFCLTGIL